MNNGRNGHSRINEVAAPVRVFDLGKALFGGREHTPKADERHVLD